MTRTTRTGAPKARRFGAWTSGGRGVYIGVSRSGHCLRRTSCPGGLGSESCYFDALPPLCLKPMNRCARSCFVALLAGIACEGGVLAVTPLQIRPVGDRPEGFQRVFDRQVDVFGLAVYATSKVPAAKIVHAAGVQAQYLDNDADGKPDNCLLYTSPSPRD